MSYSTKFHAEDQPRIQLDTRWLGSWLDCFLVGPCSGPIRRFGTCSSSSSSSSFFRIGLHQIAGCSGAGCSGADCGADRVAESIEKSRRAETCLCVGWWEEFARASKFSLVSLDSYVSGVAGGLRRGAPREAAGGLRRRAPRFPRRQAHRRGRPFRKRTFRIPSAQRSMRCGLFFLFHRFMFLFNERRARNCSTKKRREQYDITNKSERINFR